MYPYQHAPFPHHSAVQAPLKMSPHPQASPQQTQAVGLHPYFQISSPSIHPVSPPQHYPLAPQNLHRAADLHSNAGHGQQARSPYLRQQLDPGQSKMAAFNEPILHVNNGSPYLHSHPDPSKFRSPSVKASNLGTRHVVSLQPSQTELQTQTHHGRESGSWPLGTVQQRYYLDMSGNDLQPDQLELKRRSYAAPLFSTPNEWVQAGEDVELSITRSPVPSSRERELQTQRLEQQLRDQHNLMEELKKLQSDTLHKLQIERLLQQTNYEGLGEIVELDWQQATDYSTDLTADEEYFLNKAEAWTASQTWEDVAPGIQVQEDKSNRLVDPLGESSCQDRKIHKSKHVALKARPRSPEAEGGNPQQESNDRPREDITCEPNQPEAIQIPPHPWSPHPSSRSPQLRKSPNFVSEVPKKFTFEALRADDVICRFCNATGPIDMMSSQGPQHSTSCKRWAAAAELQVQHLESRPSADISSITLPDNVSKGRSSRSPSNGKNNIYSLPTLEATRSIFRASLGPSPDQNAALSEAELDHSVHAGSINYDRSIKFERTNTSPEDKRTENLAFRSASLQSDVVRGVRRDNPDQSAKQDECSIQ